MIEIVARSDAMREALRLAGRVASTDANVLVTGESGAGKDAVAVFIHAMSRRALGPFVKIDCAALPGELLEAELFGYERGAFTGATQAKPGRLEAAHKGTLVLDEIAHLSWDAQAKLLRVIERHDVSRHSEVVLVGFIDNRAIQLRTEFLVLTIAVIHPDLDQIYFSDG